MKVLALSDKVISFIYSPQVRDRFRDADIIIGCGDLSYFYLEYVMNALNKPLFFIRGNHDRTAEYSANIMRTYPHGGIDLHRRVLNHKGLLLAGVEGSLRYRPGHFQYSQSEMWWHVLALVPTLVYNRLMHGRYLDIFITHAPPASIHDCDDLPHQGIAAFLWLLKVFKPAYHFHGHVHRYRPDDVSRTKFQQSYVINTYPYCDMDMELRNSRGQ